MVIEFACECGKQYRVQEEHAGRRAKCKACNATMEVPFAPADEEEEYEGDPIFDRDVFLMRQKLISIGEKYYIWDEEENPLLFVHRKSVILGLLLAVFVAFFVGTVSVITGILMFTHFRDNAGQIPAPIAYASLFIMIVPPILAIMWMSPKRDITFYSDDTKSEVLFRLKQDKRFALIVQTFTFTDAEGNLISKFSKNLFSNILRKKWWCLSVDGGPAFVAYEDSIFLSILRRLIGPSFGLLRTNFIIQEGDGANAPVVGEFNRKATILDHYVLDMTNDPDRTIDRRSALALGVLLDTAERR